VNTVKPFFSQQPGGRLGSGLESCEHRQTFAEWLGCKTWKTADAESVSLEGGHPSSPFS